MREFTGFIQEKPDPLFNQFVLTDAHGYKNCILDDRWSLPLATSKRVVFKYTLNTT